MAGLLMIRYFALLAALIVFTLFFGFYPFAETRSQVANVNGIDCSKLRNVNLAAPKYARCAAWANSSANAPMNAAITEANTNPVDADFSFVAPELPTCKDQPKGTDEAYLYFLNAQDILDAAANSLVNEDDRDNWKKLRRESVRCLTRALSLDPSNRTYLLKRADTNDDDPLLVIKDITKVIESDLNDTSLYILRAKAYVAANQLKLALADYGKVISIEPNNPDNYLLRSIFFELHMEDKENALADANRALEINPSELQALARRASIYTAKRDYANAIKDLSALIEKQPTFDFYFLNRAVVYELAGQMDKALADTNTAIKLAPKSFLNYQHRASIYRKTGKTALAVRDDRTAKRLERQLMNETEKE